MRIAYVIEDAGPSGGAKIVMEHCSRLAARGHSITLFTVTYSDPRGWFKGLERVEIKATGTYEALEVALKAYEGCKVATWWRTASSVARSGGQGFYLVQDIETSYAGSSQEYESTMETYNLPLQHITLGSWVTAQLTDTQRVGIALDHNVFRGLELERASNGVLYNYRGHFLKNPKLFLEALPWVPPRIRFVTFGYDRPPTNRVLHMGFTSEEQLVRLYNQATVYVSTSQHEGFCLPLLEAMACGCPVITTNSDSNMEFCVNNINCLVVENRPESLALAIEHVCANKALADRLAHEGLITARRYQWDTSIDKLERVFRHGKSR
jgi:glycosyltransferase involved in cell wall biosynthesis